MAVTAPFQFARIPRAVWFPDWGPLVSHDVPFADGYSGTIDIKIEAMTPLLIGGERRGATAAKEGEVWPVQLPDGTYAIPGSSLQGMIRNILEIACFGKLGPWVDKRRFGIRDISGTATGTAAYGSRMTKKSGNAIYPQTKAGWLIRADGATKLIPCEMSKIKHDEIAKLATGSSAFDLLAILARSQPYHSKNGEPKSKDAPARYAAFLGNEGGDKTGLAVAITLDAMDAQGEKLNHSHSGGKVIQYRLCTANGSDKGTLVLTGKQSGRVKDKWEDGKKTGYLPIAHTKDMEFVFHNPDRKSVLITNAAAIPIPDDGHVWRDFESIHSAQPGRKINPNWDYWEGDFRAAKPVPIFYIEEVNDTGASIEISVIDAAGIATTKKIASGEPIPNTIAAMGTAFMFKLAHKLDTHQMLNNSSGLHLDKQRYDLPSLIFGGVGDDSDASAFKHSLKRRASFEWAEATLPSGKDVETGKASNEDRPAILLGPKPSYYPIYVRQPETLHSLYATHTPAKRRKPINPSHHTDTDGEAVARWWPELAGAKIWPNAGKSLFNSIPEHPPKTGKSVQNKLNALPIGTTFKTTLHVHNIRKAELSALLWALTFGDSDAITADDKRFGKYHHRLGMGKPLGLGEVKMAIRAVALEANSEPVEAVTLEGLTALIGGDWFAAFMDDICRRLASESNPPQAWQWRVKAGADKSEIPTWYQTSPIRAILAAAEPNAAQTLGYMELGGTKPTKTGYVGERASENSLPPFSDGWELSRIEDASDVPVEERVPQVSGGNRGGGNNVRNHGQRPPPRQTQAPQPNYTGLPFVEDSKIRRKRDQAEGFLRGRAHGSTWHASFNGGSPEIIYPEDVEVIEAPDE
jgi:CRISPR-associated protein (TIGR03986 family)